MEGHIILSLWDQKPKLCISICLWYVFHILLQSHFTELLIWDFFIRKKKLWCLQAFKFILSSLLSEKHDSCNFPNFYYVIIVYLVFDLPTFLVSLLAAEWVCTLTCVHRLLWMQWGAEVLQRFKCKPGEYLKGMRWAILTRISQQFSLWYQRKVVIDFSR